MGDIDENILNERRGPPDRPTRSELEEWLNEHLRDGMDAEPGPRTHADCPECGYRVVTGRESMGPEFDGFEETLKHVRDMYSGAFTESEFAEVARGAFEDALSEVVGDEDVDLDAETHRTLDGFETTALTFDDDLVDALLDGRKSATVRYDLDADLSPGTRLRLRSDMRLSEEEAFARATAADVIRTDLWDALDAVEDAGYQHTAESVADLWTDLNGYYEDDLGLSTPVSVVLLDDVEEVR